MSYFQKALLSLALCLSFVSNAQEIESPKKYKRALVIHGTKTNIGILIGVVRGLEKAGKPVDVIVTASGTSLPAALINALGTGKQLDDYLFGKRADKQSAHQLLKTIKVNADGAGTAISHLWNICDVNNCEETAEIFEDAPLTAPANEFERSVLGAPFRNGDKDIKVVMIAAKLAYGPEGIARKDKNGNVVSIDDEINDGEKVIQETFITDKKTGAILAQTMPHSAIATQFKDCLVNPDTCVISDITLAKGARMSTATPYLLDPVLHKGDYYAGGEIDLHAYEVGRAIAEEVVMTFPGPRDDLEEYAISSVTGYSDSERIRSITGLTGANSPDIWLDLSLLDEIYSKAEISHKIKPGNLLPWGDPFFDWQLPKDEKAFIAAINAQIEYGIKQATKSVEATALVGSGSISHITRVDEDNATAATLKKKADDSKTAAQKSTEKK